MTEIIIAGIGQTPAGEFWEKSLRELAFEATQAALLDSGGLKPQALFVGNMLAANLSQQAHLGALAADFCGLSGIEAVTLESAGASGGTALRQGYLAIASGLIDIALVLGVEKLTDVVSANVETALATGMDSDFESVHGLSPISQAALLKRRYLYEYNLPDNSLAGFPITAHTNGAANPNAMFQKPIKLESYTKSNRVSDPLNILDIAPYVDGAAAVLLARRELLPTTFHHPMIKIAGSAVVSDTLALHDRPDLLYFAAINKSTAKVLRQSGIELNQISLYEYHDTFSIYAALSLEAAGFAKRGMGWKFAQDGHIALTGMLPCGTFGGSKARGEAGGAVGIYQTVEASLQLRGQAGKNQVAGAKTALIQSLGGPASTVVSHVLVKTD
ncbi:MAG: thiolase domain-containing protein [Anaerolineales bacterium]|nr:thiolase domain-containing protein [Anaerolineales bacterium]